MKICLYIHIFIYTYMYIADGEKYTGTEFIILQAKNNIDF